MVRFVAHTNLQLPYSKFSPWCFLHCLSVNFTLDAAAILCLWLWLVKEEVLPYFLSHPAHPFLIYSPVLRLKGQLKPLLFARPLSPLWWYQACKPVALFTECFLVFWPCSLLLLFCALHLGWIFFLTYLQTKSWQFFVYSLAQSSATASLTCTQKKQELKPQIFLIWIHSSDLLKKDKGRSFQLNEEQQRLWRGKKDSVTLVTAIKP